jgi:alanine-glyoxylate transaminase/serine-glyoxylate transaminase/serine-pyruvate transaminase
VDVTVGGSQKGLMCPPGLGFNWASEKALEVHQTAGLRTQYWDWSLKRERPHYRKYCGTAPIHHIYALRAALDILLGEGLENAWKRHRAHADGVRAAVSAWAADGPLEMNAIEPAERADSVTTILTPGLDVEKFRRFCHKELGLVLGLGIGDFDGKAFRIGHMGHLSPPMILGTLAAAQVGLIVSQIPHGAGAIEAATAAIAEHF